MYTHNKIRVSICLSQNMETFFVAHFPRYSSIGSGSVVYPRGSPKWVRFYTTKFQNSRRELKFGIKVNKTYYNQLFCKGSAEGRRYDHFEMYFNWGGPHHFHRSGHDRQETTAVYRRRPHRPRRLVFLLLLCPPPKEKMLIQFGGGTFLSLW